MNILEFLIAIVAILAIFVVPVIAVLVFFLRLARGGGREGDKHTSKEEAGLIQEIYHGLSKMETRIEALETILLDRDRKDK